MTPVTQTRVGSPSGNCTEAAIASLLDVQLDDVPDLWQPECDTDPSAPNFRVAGWVRMHRWLRGRGLIYVQVRAAEADALDVFRSAFGPDYVAGRHYLRMGYNPDGVGHCVVGLDGATVWDPNPLRRGVTGVDEVVFLAELDRVPEGYRSWPGVQLPTAFERWK